MTVKWGNVALAGGLGRVPVLVGCVCGYSGLRRQHEAEN